MRIQMRFFLAAILFLFLLFLTGLGQHSQESHRHKKKEEIKNPIKSDKESIERGKSLYGKHCVTCHGKEGKGDGPAAKDMDPPAADLTDKIWKHGSSDGEIFSVITNGIPETGMDGFKTNLKERERWDLVNFIRSLSSKEAIYTCPMHPEVRSDKPGKCPKCGMALAQKSR